MSLIGGYAIIYSTRWGPWAFSDSTEYIATARNLIAGRGLGMIEASGDFSPLHLHTPLYPFTLGVIGIFGVDPLLAARWLNVFFFSSFILVMGFLSYTLTKTTWLSLSICLLTITSPVLLGLFSGAISEPLFLLTGVASLFLLILFTKLNYRWVFLLAVMAAALASMTRYMGYAYIVTNTFGLLFLLPDTWRTRFKVSLTYATLSSIPMIVWILRLANLPSATSYFLGGLSSQDTTGISLVHIWSSLTPARLIGSETVWGWLPAPSSFDDLHYRLKLAIYCLVIFGVIVLLFIGILRRRLVQNQGWKSHMGIRIIGLFTLFILVYLTILSFSYVYVVKATFDNRILSPIYITLMVIGLMVCYFVLDAKPSSKWLSLLPVAVTVAYAVFFLPASISLASNLHHSGLGYTSQAWQQSPTIEGLLELPSVIPIISNETAPILLLTKRPAYEFDELYLGEPKAYFSQFGESRDDSGNTLFREEGAVFVIFDSVYWQLYPLYKNSTQDRLEALTKDLWLYGRYSDGSIFFYQDPNR